MPRGKSCCSTWTRPMSSNAWSTLPRIPRLLATSNCCARCFVSVWDAMCSCCLLRGPRAQRVPLAVVTKTPRPPVAPRRAGHYRPRGQRPVPSLCIARRHPSQSPARAVSVYRIAGINRPIFGAAIRRMLGRVGRASGCGRCAVSPAVCRGTRGVGASYL